MKVECISFYYGKFNELIFDCFDSLINKISSLSSKISCFSLSEYLPLIGRCSPLEGYRRLSWMWRGYKGDLENGQPHGIGEYIYSNGAKYKGEFKNGQPHGNGEYIYSNRAKYEGQFENGQFHGQGILSYVSGTKYIGNFKNDKFHGRGTYIDSIGKTSYTGDFEEGLCHGKGTLTYQSGETYQGEFVKDKIRGEGSGVIYDENGDCYAGNFRDAQIEGKGSITHHRDLNSYSFSLSGIYEGNFIQGLPQAGGVLKDFNGNEYKGEVRRNGKPHGKGVLTYRNGDIYEGTFSDGKPNWKGTLTLANDRGVWTLDGAKKGTGAKKGKGTFIFSDVQFKGSFWVNRDGSVEPNQGTLIYGTGNNRREGWFNRGGYDYFKGETPPPKLTYENKDVYEGNFRDLKPNGRGTLTFNNKDCYEGDILDGMPHGEGVLRYNSKKVDKGKYTIQEKVEIPNEISYSDGSTQKGQSEYILCNHTVRKTEEEWYEGSFVHGLRQGKGVFRRGEVHRGGEEFSKLSFKQKGEFFNDKFIG